MIGIKSLTRVVSILNMASRPSLYLYEGWQDEAGIDNTVWTVTDPATGNPWSRGVAAIYVRAICQPFANETCRLRSNQRWLAAPTVYGKDTILRRLTLEFEMKLADVANMDNTKCFFGLNPLADGDRGSNSIIGWSLAADVLQSITDNGGAETVNTGFGETLTDWNKLKIDIYEGHVKFFINEVEVADHTTNLPSLAMWLNFFVDTEGAALATIELGIIRAWTEDIAR